MLVLEVESDIFGRENIRGLDTDCMGRVIREKASGCSDWSHRYRAAICGYLPLIVTNNAKLQQSAEIFLQRKNLPEAPFVGEGLPRSLARAIRPGP